MSRFFNVSGPCAPDAHYMLPAEARLEGVDLFIERGLYFVIHAPRQVGKTTAFRALAKRLTAEGRYAALHTSCEETQRIIEPILTGEKLAEDVLDDDLQFAMDLGLVRSDNQDLKISNPIYREIIPRVLTQLLEMSIELPRPS